LIKVPVFLIPPILKRHPVSPFNFQKELGHGRYMDMSTFVLNFVIPCMVERLKTYHLQYVAKDKELGKFNYWHPN
jgi:hypothetical protein